MGFPSLRSVGLQCSVRRQEDHTLTSSPPSSSLTFRRSHVKTHYRYLRLLHTCICGALRAAVGRRVCALLLRFCGTEEGGVQYSPKGASHDSSLLHTLVPPSPTHKLNPPIYHIFFLLDPQTQISYRRPATRHSAGMTFLGSFQQYGGFRPWWRGLV